MDAMVGLYTGPGYPENMAASLLSVIMDWLCLAQDWD